MSFLSCRFALADPHPVGIAELTGLLPDQREPVRVMLDSTSICLRAPVGQWRSFRVACEVVAAHTGSDPLTADQLSLWALRPMAWASHAENDEDLDLDGILLEGARTLSAS